MKRFDWFILIIICLLQLGLGRITFADESLLQSREIHYWYMSFPGGVKELRRLFTPRQLDLLQKLNRRDLKHLAKLDRLVVPARFSRDELAYSPLPLAYSWAKQYPKALVVHHPSQAFGGYEQGRLIHWGPVSTGDRKHPTPAGLFHLNWRSQGRHSTVNPDWYMPWYFNFANKKGLAFHAYKLEGQPASHGCIRLLEEDAQWLFEWGEQWELDHKGWKVFDPGTPVLIIGHYDFDQPPPWRSLEWLIQGADLPENPV